MFVNRLSSLKAKIGPNLGKIIANTFWLFADRIVQMGLSLFVGIWVTRYLGAEQFGTLNFSIAFVGLFGVVSNLGLDGIVVREVVQKPNSTHQILGTTLYLRLISAFGTTLLSIGLIFVFRPDDPIIHQLVAILATTSFFTAFPIELWFQSQVDSKYVVWSKNAAYILMCFVRIALIQLKAPLVFFAWAALLEVTLSTLAQIALYHFRHRDFHKWRFELRWAKSLLKDSWPLIISGMVIIVYMRIDQLMLGQMISDKEVGIYSAAVKISELWFFVPGAILSSLFPSIIQAKDNPELYYSRLQKLFYLMSALAYTVAVPITFGANWIVRTLYGEEFIEAAPILSLHIWTGLFVSLGLTRGLFLVTEGLLKFSAWTSAGGAAINVVLNFLLIPPLGGIGAAIATVFAQIFATYLTNLFNPKLKVIFAQQTRAILLAKPLEIVLSKIRNRLPFS